MLQGREGFIPTRKVWESLKEPLSQDAESQARLGLVEMGWEKRHCQCGWSGACLLDCKKTWRWRKRWKRIQGIWIWIAFQGFEEDLCFEKLAWGLWRMTGGKDGWVSLKSLYSGRSSNPSGLSDDTHFLFKNRALTLSWRQSFCSGVAFKLRWGVNSNRFGEKKQERER